MKNYLIILSVLSLIAISATLPLGEGYKIGDKATDFSLKNIDGTMVSMADYPNAKGFILIFTCNSCPYAVMYEDRIKALDEKYSDNGYPVIAINPNDPSVKPADGFAQMQQRAQDKGFDFPYLLDEGQNVFPAYGATKTPHVFLLDKNKTVQYIGAIDDNARSAADVDVNFVDNAIAALESGTTPDPAITKAIGCSIKTK